MIVSFVMSSERTKRQKWQLCRQTRLTGKSILLPLPSARPNDPVPVDGTTANYAVARNAVLPSPVRSCYPPVMLRTRIRKNAAAADHAVRLLAEVSTSIETLHDEDLLDLADIFSSNADSILAKIASAEMQKRKISL
ncbi:hypothetical protein [Sphingomonas sp. CFBP 13720]|uniref:hypothetical protein n=1 Tax=Sphingomonas sp. CFBP 13720 TaxID=2775302 RepID=UPI0020171CF6|nr:hypothetical protein [Sphingomonas sp. CFBP 13720]